MKGQPKLEVGWLDRQQEKHYKDKHMYCTFLASSFSAKIFMRFMTISLMHSIIMSACACSSKVDPFKPTRTTSLSTEGHGMRQECIIEYHNLINRRTQKEAGMYYTIPQPYQQKGTEGDRNVLYNTTSLSTEGHRRRQECIIQYHKLINRRTQNETGMYYTIPQAYQQKGTEGDRNVLYNTTSLSTEGHGMRQECIIQYHKLINRRARKETGMYYTIPQAYQQKDTE